MATANNVQAWSSTAASNATADSTISSSDTQSPDTVDNDIRNVMAAVRNHSKDTGGALVVGGTSTALTITTNQVISSGHIANGYSLRIRTASASTGAATIAIDGIAAVSIKANDGNAIAAGSWASGAIVDLVYSSTATAFIAANIASSARGSSIASFHASKSANQTISSTAETTVTFDTEEFDVGSYFASNTWTPPAGKVTFGGKLVLNNLSATAKPVIHIKKNGSTILDEFAIDSRNSGNEVYAYAFSGIDDANGTDAYTITVSSSDSSYTVVGAQTYVTSFWGYAI